MSSKTEKRSGFFILENLGLSGAYFEESAHDVLLWFGSEVFLKNEDEKRGIYDKKRLRMASGGLIQL